jgi:glycerophosphoryl diester phosphodiesterase
MDVNLNSCQRIGHGGASALAPANTLASFDAAVEVGIDMVEFDLRAWQGELILAHTIVHARLNGGVGLRQALSHLATRRFAGVELNVDVKHPGCEGGLLAALHSVNLLDRTLISSPVPMVLDRVRALEPRARLGISIGGRMARLNRRWRDWRRHVLAGLSSGRWDGLMAQHRLVNEALVGAVQERGGRLYAWTVNERPLIDRLRAIGVDGITTADPRLFA